ncbi:MAG: hypothetical protein H0T53_12065 [Herpetosiphonaceae bacterium]|nr:hypothetical protein [Herpetosiphonaceae bacterium]
MPTPEEQAAQDLSEAVDRAIRGLSDPSSRPSETEADSSKAPKGRKREETIVVQQRRRPSGRKK